MKKRVIFLTALLMLTTRVWASDIRVELDGEDVEFSQQKPVIVDGRTLIPIRGVFEKLGYEIRWDADTKTASFENGESTILITAESSIFLMNGEEVSLDVPASILNGSMLLPLRAVGEAAGVKVNWNGETKTVYLETSDEESSYEEDMAELTENAETVYQESVIYSLLSLYLPDEHNRRERIAEMFLITDDRSDLNNVTAEGSEITEIFKKASEELLPDLVSEDLYNIILAFFEAEEAYYEFAAKAADAAEYLQHPTPDYSDDEAAAAISEIIGTTNINPKYCYALAKEAGLTDEDEEYAFDSYISNISAFIVSEIKSIDWNNPDGAKIKAAADNIEEKLNSAEAPETALQHKAFIEKACSGFREASKYADSVSEESKLSADSVKFCSCVMASHTVLYEALTGSSNYNLTNTDYGM